MYKKNQSSSGFYVIGLQIYREILKKYRKKTLKKLLLIKILHIEIASYVIYF